MHPLHALPLLLLLLTTLSLSDPIERSALLAFKSSITSDPSRFLTDWTTSTPHCTWPGISCSSSSKVISLNISATLTTPPSKPAPLTKPYPDPNTRFTGNLTPSLSKLTQLQILSLPFHNFTSQIPTSIWTLQNLQVLDLQGNSLTGTLPSIFPLKLRTLSLSSNQITGSIPNSLSTCLYLETLDLSFNQINSSIPDSFTNLTKLKEIRLSFNHIGGEIPYSIGIGCRNLQLLDLSGNLLVGGIPRNLGNCINLQTLLLFSNLLDEVIPPEIGRLRKLRVLDVSRNSLSGAVPVELGNCVELSVLVLFNLYDPLEDLGYGDNDGDEFNYFQGGVSERITSLPKLRVLWAPRVMSEGEFPENWGPCRNLEVVNLAENLFTGGIPRGLGRCENLRFFNVSSNNLTGGVSEKIQVPCMDVFDVSGNKLSGSFPRFVYGQCNRSMFPTDDLVAAYLSFFLYRSLEGIGLASSVYHNFGRNNFSGSLASLPIAAGRLRNQSVYAFIADGNSLVGSLSDSLFGKCVYFSGLIANLSNNLISGGIPEDIGTKCRSLMVLDVSGNRLTGKIPESFGSSIVGLNLNMNRLQGQIPASFGELKGLKYLSLAGNNLSGHVPANLDQLRSLEVLDLSSNSLSGEIPSGFVKLRNLSVLLLNNNKLSGKIPSGFSNETFPMIFNVSYNNLSGPLPLNASTFRCDSVLGNPFLESCHVFSLSIPPSYVQGRSGDSQAYTDPPPQSPPTKNGSSGFSSIEIASITSASAIVSVLFALVILYIYTRKCAPNALAPAIRREVSIFVDIGVPLTYENVVRATGNFNASNCIGSGGFGATYKAEVSPGVLVAIKRLSVGRIQGVQQFHAEIKTLGRWRHPNLVTLIGYHVGDQEMFLVYNYLPGGNLEKFIQERSKRAVDWRMLHKIALDVARALAYLHDQCVPRILHRDVKPSNILLDNDYNAYLSDFGLARLLGNSETHATTGVAGTFGYVAPEYAMTCRVSDKADVYSYGVVLLELISDKKALDPSFSPYGNGFNIVAWACMLMRQGRSREFFTDGLWDVAPHDDLVETLHLAVKCTGESLTDRPTMNRVVRCLKELQPPAC